MILVTLFADQHFKPQQRFMSRREMKELTQKCVVLCSFLFFFASDLSNLFALSLCRMYKKLPEVVRAAEEKKRADQYQLNRLRAKLYQKVG